MINHRYWLVLAIVTVGAFVVGIEFGGMSIRDGGYSRREPQGVSVDCQAALQCVRDLETQVGRLEDVMVLAQASMPSDRVALNSQAASGDSIEALSVISKQLVALRRIVEDHDSRSSSSAVTVAASSGERDGVSFSMDRFPLEAYSNRLLYNQHRQQFHDDNIFRTVRNIFDGHGRPDRLLSSKNGALLLVYEVDYGRGWTEVYKYSIREGLVVNAEITFVTAEGH